LEPENEDTITAEFLDEHFRDIAAIQGLDPDSAYVQQLKEAIEKSLRDVDERVFSTTMSSEAYYLKEAALEIEQAIQRRGIELPSKPYFGILYTGCVNGQAIRIPDTQECIIALHSGTLKLFHQISDLISYLLPVVSEDGGFEFLCDVPDHELIDRWKAEIHKKPEAIEQLILIVLSYLEPHKQISQKLIRKDTPGRFKIASNLAAGARLFLIGHEYGHIVSNHRTSPKELTKIINNGNTSISLIEQNWDREFEADSCGGNFAIGAMLHAIKQLEHCVVAIDTFFTSLHLLEMCRDISVGKYLVWSDSDYREPGWSDTHPPIVLRRDNIFAHLRATFGEDLRASEEVCKYIRFGLRCLFESAQPLLIPKRKHMFLSSMGLDREKSAELLRLLGTTNTEGKIDS